MAEGITVRILGDFGPFSRMGKSIGYEVKVGQSRYLIDCGSPIFQQIGGHGLKNVNGLIITHCHDDHKRWLTDLALFNMYAPDIPHKISLFTAENINEELREASGAALDRSLSDDSKTIIDIPYNEYITSNLIGPRAKYKIVSKYEGEGKKWYYITDRDGNMVAPDVAKIVINPKTGRPRMLLRDPEYREWVEPESFYPFSSTVFYEGEQNIYKDREGFTIQAIKSPVWHGIPGIGIKFKTAEETLIFSSDTVHDRELWARLYMEKRIQMLTMPEKEFESSSVIYGDINDYIERIWSEERYKNAVNAFNDAIVIHDISGRNSVVHTDYKNLKTAYLSKDKTLLTHSPDRIISEWVLSNSGKTFKIKGSEFYEVVGKELYSMDADIYYRTEGKYFVGYRNENGRYVVYEKDDLLGISDQETLDDSTFLYRIDLYEDISGRYFPKIDDENALYFERKDRRIERIEFTERGSTGKVVGSIRGKIFKR
jgi:ribonuclease BN (tRNA processing enzyme)